MARRIGMAAPPKAQCVLGTVAFGTRYSRCSNSQGQRSCLGTESPFGMPAQSGGRRSLAALEAKAAGQLLLAGPSGLLRCSRPGNCKDDAPGRSTVGTL